MTSLNVTDSRITRINELQRIIAPIQMNLENLEENIHRFKELSNAKLVQYIKDTNTMGIEPDTILKKFGQDNDVENFFSTYNAILSKYFAQLEEKYNIREELYPYSNELSSINKEIEQEKKSIADGETLVQIANSIGQKLEHNSELYEQNKAEYRYKYARSLERMFNIDWNASYITILKVSAKTVSIRVGEYENKRVPKETMIKQFPMLKVMENQNA